MSKTKYDLNFKEIEFIPRSGYTSSSLTILLSGKDMNVKIANAIRRVSMQNIPVYAFPPQLISILKNTCVAFDNDYMNLRLSTLPIFDIDTDLFSLHEKYWENINYADPKREKHPSEKHIELHINVHNNSDVIKNVTTNDAKLIIDGTIVDVYDNKYPILLIKLRPNDTFKCDMLGALGIGDNPINGAIWYASRNSYYEYDDSIEYPEFKLTVQSNGQMSEYVILYKSCEYIIKKLEDISKELIRKIDTKEIKDNKQILFVLDGEDHTIGELLNIEFQNHPDIAFSGIKKPDHLIKSVTIKILSKNDNSPTKVMLKCIDSIIEKIQVLKKYFDKKK